jgi:hypothetical protein
MYIKINRDREGRMNVRKMEKGKMGRKRLG